MNEHPACVTRGDGTVDDGGTNSFWRDFATRVAHGREREREWWRRMQSGQSGQSVQRGRGRGGMRREVAGERKDYE